jgi:transposase
MMEIKLHANATTTPRVRRYIQQSDKSDRILAQELGISVATVRRWRQRQDVTDRHTVPKTTRKVLTDEQSLLINWLRQKLQLPLDELLVVVNQGMQQPISRAGLDRYLRGVGQRGETESRALRGKKAVREGELPGTLALFYQRISLLPEDGGEQHLLWAEEKISGWLSARAFAGASPMLVVNWLKELLPHCPGDIQSIETENKKLFGNSESQTPPLQLWCREQGIKLQQPVQPQMEIALRLESQLTQLLPAAENSSLDTVLKALCASYNQHWPQKKLGGLTPAAFWLQHWPG